MDHASEASAEIPTTRAVSSRRRARRARVLAGCVFVLWIGCGDEPDTSSGIEPNTTDGGFSGSADAGDLGSTGGSTDASGDSGPGATGGGSLSGTAGGRADGGSGSSGPSTDGGAATGGFPGGGGTGADASADARVGSPDAGVPTTDAGAGGNVGSSCPAGFESVLPLVLNGATVPGNLELGLATTPETPRAPCGLPQEQICFNLINAEREKAGKAPLIWDGDLADLGRSHAADRSQRRYPGTQHGSSTSDTHLYQQRAEFLGLKRGKFRSVVENACKGARTGQSAFQCWLGSAGHRAVMLSEGSWSTLKYAACGGDGSEWNLELGY